MLPRTITARRARNCVNTNESLTFFCLGQRQARYLLDDVDDDNETEKKIPYFFLRPRLRLCYVKRVIR